MRLSIHMNLAVEPISSSTLPHPAHVAANMSVMSVAFGVVGRRDVLPLRLAAASCRTLRAQAASSAWSLRIIHSNVLFGHGTERNVSMGHGPERKSPIGPLPRKGQAAHAPSAQRVAPGGLRSSSPMGRRTRLRMRMRQAAALWGAQRAGAAPGQGHITARTEAPRSAEGARARGGE